MAWTASRPVSERGAVAGADRGVAQQVGQPVEVAEVDELGVAGDQVARSAVALSVTAWLRRLRSNVRSASSQ